MYSESVSREPRSPRSWRKVIFKSNLDCSDWVTWVRKSESKPSSRNEAAPSAWVVSTPERSSKISLRMERIFTGRLVALLAAAGVSIEGLTGDISSRIVGALLRETSLCVSMFGVAKFAGAALSAKLLPDDGAAAAIAAAATAAVAGNSSQKRLRSNG